MTRHAKTLGKHQTAKPFKGRIFLGIFIAISLGLQVFFAIEVSGAGAQIAGLEEEVGVLTRQNRELEDKLVNLTSLIKLREKAEELGFTTRSDTYYIEKGQVFATNLP